MYFRRKELEKFRSFNGPLIDVRSPSEYYKGHMPNSINITLFDDDERSIIGTIYKKEGRKKAVIEGLKFFEKKIEIFLDNLFMNIESYKAIPNKNNEFFIRIYCSRGGMRSQSIAWLIEKYKYDKLMAMDEDIVKLYFVNDPKANYLFWLNNLKLDRIKTIWCPQTTLWNSKKIQKDCYLINERLALIKNIN